MEKRRETRLGVYVHYPYCAVRCPYCDFNVVQPGPEGRPEARYREAVLAELDVRAEAFAGRPAAVSLYFGGGTPALWPAREIAAVIEGVDARVGLAAGAEITVEGNPGELTAASLSALRSAGVNRLSLGTQSFNDAVLRQLGRRNTAEDNRRCVSAARAAGFDNLSLDLIQAVAGQTTADALADVAEVLALQPEHVSTYELTIHAQTPFGSRAARGEVLTADEDTQVEIYVESREALRAGGIEPYEISNAARAGRRAVHNALYWSQDEYLALGAGAHGFRLTGDALGQGERWENERHAGRYMAAALDRRPGERSREVISVEMLREERVLTGLRVDAGLEVDASIREAHGPAALRLVERGWLAAPSPDRWALTDAGRLLLDRVLRDLLEDGQKPQT